MRRSLLSVLLLLSVVGLPVGAAASTATGEEVDGGAAATQATPIEPGTTYVDDVNSGEARWFSFDAGSLQVLGATMTEYGEVDYGCCLNINLYGPDFDTIETSDSLSGQDTAQTVRVETDEEGVEQAGTYYVEVVLDADQANRPVPFEFVVDVSGEPAETPTPSAESSSPESSSPESSNPEEAATDSETAQADASQTSAAAAQSADDGGDGLLWVVVGLLALLVVLLLVALVFMFVRMQKQPPRA